jgi:hypothetical protein
LIRKLLPTTLKLERAIAAAATMGFSNPSAASGYRRDVVEERPEHVKQDHRIIVSVGESWR